MAKQYERLTFCPTCGSMVGLEQSDDQLTYHNLYEPGQSKEAMTIILLTMLEIAAAEYLELGGKGHALRRWRKQAWKRLGIAQFEEEQKE